MLRRVFSMAMVDLLQTVKDRPSIFWMVIMPVVFIYAFGAMNSGGGVQTVRINLLVADEDQSFLSGSFCDALTAEGFNVARMAVIDADSIASRPRCLHIPVGFQDSVALGHQVTLRLHRRPNTNDEATITAEMHLQRAIIETITNLAEAQRKIAGPGPTPGEPSANSPLLVIDEAFEAAFVATAAESSRVFVEAKTAGRGRPVPSGKGQSFPATLTLFMLINTAIYGAVFLTQEKQDQILPRIATYAVSHSGILVGKLLGRTLLALLQAIILILAGKFLLGVYLGNSPVGLAAVVLCLALTVASISLFWGAVLRRVEQATAVVLVVSLFLGAMGGCWWPLEVVPSWLRTAGHISPAAWALDGFHALISYGAGAEAVVLPCLILLAYAAVFTALGARFLRYTS